MIDDIEKRARELLAAEMERSGRKGTANKIRQGRPAMFREELRAIMTALTLPEDHVVVTRNEVGQAVAVTRQDDEGRILSVIAEFEYPQWQPIETAPKDGQYILACDEDATLVTHWMEGGWYEGEDRYEYFYWEPSHWMALPAKPEVKNVND